MNNALTVVYAIIALLEITAEFFNGAEVLTGGEASINYQLLRFATKPLLMPILIALFVSSTSKLFNLRNLLIVAFFFSWVGDVALMFVFKNENFFLAGLVGFLITHILYIVAFAKISGNKIGFLKRFPWVAIPLLLYFSILIVWIFPNVPSEMKIPVVVYSLTIVIMVLSAMNNFSNVPKKVFANTFIGALLFMISDSIIAINKFVFPVAFAGVLIMVLYISGQYFIAKGFSKFGNEVAA